jgi:hypothetical protein
MQGRRFIEDASLRCCDLGAGWHRPCNCSAPRVVVGRACRNIASQEVVGRGPSATALSPLRCDRTRKAVSARGDDPRVKSMPEIRTADLDADSGGSRAGPRASAWSPLRCDQAAPIELPAFGLILRSGALTPPS